MKAFAAIALVLHVGPAWASSAVTEGTLQAREAGELVAVPLEHTEVKIRIDGFIADVEVDQKFHNPYTHKIEAVYLFPLPAQSAVDGYELVTGGRTIKGEIKLRDEAKAVYKAAVTKGYVAALLTQERPNLFTQAVANIEPGAVVDVKLHYVQALAYDSGAYELVFPMVAGPRFVPKSSKVDPKTVQPAVVPAGMRSRADIGLAVELDAGVPVHQVRSPSHAITVAATSSNAAKVQIGAGDTIPNKDFVLRYDVAGKQPEFAILPHRTGGKDGAFFLMAQPPVAPGAAEITPKEMVFVIDTSSSMQGKPLAKAKEAIRNALKGMHPDDTFQIVRFDDSASALGGKPIANKPKNVELATAWLDGLQAGGGTDMTTGIRAALAFPHDKARLRIVMFLTDGFIGNEDEILALVQDKLGESRLFSFGVGSAVNRYLLEEMAAIGRGTVQVVRPDEDTAAAVAKLEKRIASPLLTDVAIDWKGLAVADVTPGKIPDLFAGQPLVLAGRYAKGGTATIAVSGKLAGRPVTFDVPVTLPETRDRPAIAAIWARGQITQLMRQQLRAEKPAIKQKVIDLALAHHLMSQYTAFVAVDASRVTKGGKAEQVAVPVEVPDGLHSTQGNYGGSGNGVIYGVEGAQAQSAGGGAGASYHMTAGYLGVAKEADLRGRADGLDAADDDRTASMSNPLSVPKADKKAKSANVEDSEEAGVTRSVAGKDEPKAEPRDQAKREPSKPGPTAQPAVTPAAPPAPPAPKKAEPERRPADADTSVAAMRADVLRCWSGDAKGHVQLGMDFDIASGISKGSISVSGDAPAPVNECIRAAAKKWRSFSRAHLDLGINK